MKYHLSLLLLLAGAGLKAQTNVIKETGKVGIGITTPSDYLQVHGGNIRVSNSNGYPFGVSLDMDATVSWAREFSFTHSNAGKMACFGVYSIGSNMNYAYIGGNTTATTAHAAPWMTFKPNGYVGIGTTNPHTIFSVSGGVTIYAPINSAGPRPALAPGTITGEIRGTSPGWYGGDDGFMRLSAGGGTNAGTKSFIDLSGYTATQPDMFQNIVMGTSGAERLRIASNGNVGIGTNNPGAKLAVNGDIKAQKIKVTTTEWPDYVFQSDYKLPGLLEVADFITAHKHLPGVPSEADVKKEGSVDVGQMNEILLRKIEELTLYMIELKKENIALKGRLEKVEAR
ncbi:hypothetical protein [Chitinophaga solisilvae]|uniref:hypothetical protein n=1 Tax=Chitinophaga solisilvae TaxID=1233460 RepID=UPI00136E0330|nr:hypothetical protein [Chitinophaga solisilvae]